MKQLHRQIDSVQFFYTQLFFSVFHVVQTNTTNKTVLLLLLCFLFLLLSSVAVMFCCARVERVDAHTLAVVYKYKHRSVCTASTDLLEGKGKVLF